MQCADSDSGSSEGEDDDGADDEEQEEAEAGDEYLIAKVKQGGVALDQLTNMQRLYCSKSWCYCPGCMCTCRHLWDLGRLLERGLGQLGCAWWVT